MQNDLTKRQGPTTGVTFALGAFSQYHTRLKFNCIRFLITPYLLSRLSLKIAQHEEIELLVYSVQFWIEY